MNLPSLVPVLVSSLALAACAADGPTAAPGKADESAELSAEELAAIRCSFAEAFEGVREGQQLLSVFIRRGLISVLAESSSPEEFWERMDPLRRAAGDVAGDLSAGLQRLPRGSPDLEDLFLLAEHLIAFLHGVSDTLGDLSQAFADGHLTWEEASAAVGQLADELWREAEEIPEIPCD